LPFKAFDVDLNRMVNSLRDQVDKGHRFACPECNKEMVFVDAKLKCKHFRHKRDPCSFVSEPETEDHLEMKRLVAEALNGEVEVKIGNKWADVACKDLSLVVEVQCSNIPMEAMVERTKEFNGQGYHVMWLFHPDFLVWTKRKKMYVGSRGKKMAILFSRGRLMFLDPHTRMLGVYLLKWIGGRCYRPWLKRWIPFDRNITRLIRKAVTRSTYGTFKIAYVWVEG